MGGKWGPLHFSASGVGKNTQTCTNNFSRDGTPRAVYLKTGVFEGQALARSSLLIFPLPLMKPGYNSSSKPGKIGMKDFLSPEMGKFQFEKFIRKEAERRNG